MTKEITYMGKVKVALVGAGSCTFGPGTVCDILLSEPLAAKGVELVLMDKSPDPLPIVERYARRVAQELERDVTITSTTELEPALDGASYVVTAFEESRGKYWAQDYHVARKYGFPQAYGENGGPGGLFHALRGIGPFVHVAQSMERLCPDALLINFSNPMHKLCESVSRLTKTPIVGLCHGVYIGMGQIAFILGRKQEALDLQACGINHFTWFQTVRDKQTGEDLYPALRAAELEGDWLCRWHEMAMARVLFRRFGLYPSPGTNHFGEYIRWADEFYANELNWYYEPTEGKPWDTGKVPELVYYVGTHTTDRPWRNERRREPDNLDERPLKATGESVVPIMEGITCGINRDLPAVNLPNRQTQIPNLPSELVVETPATVDSQGIHPQVMAPLPEGIAAMIRTQASIQQLLVEAYAEQSKNKLLQAVLLEPTVDSYHRAVEYVDEMLALQKEILPPLR